ncbi:probable calcium-binding protein CML35 [Dioscorea cayenensis subsp. rotundata]|uniref:Probable calcium-binding protein CML35 n=1 Tax=Dioscorea cayennensis subsp. rotundata TaxID=55577 RepID=A0AB40BJT8_DIOCR|nr:probable calcium-binding protein CML35 [Dioscorea cayenensis subsp. rotundata]
MKLTFGSLFGSSTKPVKKAKRARTREISRSETSSSSAESSTRSEVISRRELEAVLRRLGPEPPSEEEVAAMMAEVEGGAMSLEAIGALGGSGRRSMVGMEMREAFAVFDADRDGRISAEELKAVLEEWCSLEDCRRIIGEVDADGDGLVGFEDFVRMMRMDEGL